MREFKEIFQSDRIPQTDELNLYWQKEISRLFHGFSDFIMEKYDLRFAIPTWNRKYGWTYRIGKSGIYMFSGMHLFHDGFLLDGIKVTDEVSYHKLLTHVDEVYQAQKDDFYRKISDKNKRQAERNKERISRERQEKELLRDKILPEKYNKLRWPEKLDIAKLRRLYLLDAEGICDMELADEIGLTLLIRCQYGRSDAELMEQYAIRCHHCDKIIYGNTDFRECECGYQYSYREYRRSYHKNNMPSGAAAKVFDRFVAEWGAAVTYQQKMLLIDSLLHEFHLSLVSGTVHRPVAMNFIDGTRKKIEGIITELSL